MNLDLSSPFRELAAFETDLHGVFGDRVSRDATCRRADGRKRIIRRPLTEQQTECEFVTQPADSFQALSVNLQSGIIGRELDADASGVQNPCTLGGILRQKSSL